MASFVLVHGACHGAWCWRDLAPLLREAGHEVLTPDLPGIGRIATPAPANAGVARMARDAEGAGDARGAGNSGNGPVAGNSLSACIGHIAEVVETLPEPAILVGHSMAGGVISGVAEKAPESVRLLVYLTAFLPVDGETLADLVRRSPESRASPDIIEREGVEYLSIGAENLREAFYQDADDDILDFVSGNLVPEPAETFRTPVALSAARYGTVARAYILCLQDRAIAVTLQRRMIEASPCDPVLEIDSGHSPFFTRPQELATLLAGLA